MAGREARMGRGKSEAAADEYLPPWFEKAALWKIFADNLLAKDNTKPTIKG